MQHAQRQVPPRRELDQGVQQEHRVRSSGHRDAHPIARFKHVITGDGFQNSIEHHSDSSRVLTNLSILTLYVVTSSVRTLIFDEAGRQVPGLGSQLPYQVTTTADGGVEMDADELAALAIRSLTETHGQIGESGRRVHPFRRAPLWPKRLGVGWGGRPTPPPP